MTWRIPDSYELSKDVMLALMGTEGDMRSMAGLGKARIKKLGV